MDARATLFADFGRIGMRTTLRRGIRREQVGAPLNLDIVFLLKLIDPNLADIAEWSDVV